MSRMANLCRSAEHVYHTEGLASLIGRGFRFLAYCFAEYRVYYVYVDSLEDIGRLNEAEFRPRVAGVSFKVVSSNGEADELEAQGLEFRSCGSDAREWLENGAIACCVFVGRELGNVVWVATNQRAQHIIGEPPYRVDYSNNETCAGGLWTNPKYRRMRLRTYNRLERFRYLRAQEVTTVRGVIARRNTVAYAGRVKLGFLPCAEGRYVRLLWWESWKEKPLSPSKGDCSHQS